MNQVRVQDVVGYKVVGEDGTPRGKVVCPNCQAGHPEYPLAYEEVLTAKKLDRTTLLFCDDCGLQIGAGV